MLLIRIIIQYLLYFKSILHLLEINLHQNSYDSRCNQISRLTIYKININALTQRKWISLNFIFVLIKSSLHTDSWDMPHWMILENGNYYKDPNQAPNALHHHHLLTQLCLRVEHQFRSWATKTYRHELVLNTGLVLVFNNRGLLNL